MPFTIIRNDITKVRADAIVNTANPKPVIGGGTDAAIYFAAGKEKLLAERKKIGDIKRGDAAVTPAFGLQAKYVIHTVGPAWEDGRHGEFEILKNCYKNSLWLALEKGCESIAFPLIATGVYGFPKDKALQVATSAIQDFLFENDMSIMLVVFDRKAFELSGKVFSDVQSYVDENYVKRTYHREYRGRRREDELLNSYRAKESLPLLGGGVPRSETEEGNEENDLAEASVKMSLAETTGVFADGSGDMTLDEVIANPGDTFQERLFALIDKSGRDDVAIYKKANITKKVFSDIRSKKNYHPSKRTAVAFAIALELPMDEALDLLARAGFALSPSSRFDLIVGYFISHGIYDMMTINEALFANRQECIGTKI